MKHPSHRVPDRLRGPARRALEPAAPAAILAGLLLAGLLAAVLAAGCGSDLTGSAATPTGRLVSVSACKPDNVLGSAGARPEQDCIAYSYRLGALELKHVNAALNCCPEFDASVTVSGDTIFVVEDELAGVCRCLCLYDLEYKVYGLTLAVYRVIVREEYLLETDEPLEFTMDLRASPSGLHCVNRDHYPWAQE